MSVLRKLDFFFQDYLRAVIKFLSGVIKKKAENNTAQFILRPEETAATALKVNLLVT